MNFLKQVILLTILPGLLWVTPTLAQEKTLNYEQLAADLEVFEEQLTELSSYHGLNGYRVGPALQVFLGEHPTGCSATELGVFLSREIGEIGDRHAYARGYDLPNSKYLPFVVAPLNGKVIALEANREKRRYDLKYPDHPYLTAVNGVEIQAFLQQIAAAEKLAPDAAFQTRAVRKMKYLEEHFAANGWSLPASFTFTFANADGEEKQVQMPLDTTRRFRTWQSKISSRAPDGEKLNDPETAQEQFSVDEHGIAYVRIPDMVHPEDAPNYYQALDGFMQNIDEARALIIDVRGNGGGTRHLIMELAKYIVAPDAIHVVNVSKQRLSPTGELTEKRSLNNRFLFAYEELDKAEKRSVKSFMKTFSPVYELPKTTFSDYHYTILNGSKLSTGKHFDRPVYILADERTFSAASILVGIFKDLPNVKTVGINTDGSSGNSEKFELPNSGIRVKISTMVSFQKDGQLFDGTGTAPDIRIERSLEQVRWQEDFQLKELKKLILN